MTEQIRAVFPILETERLVLRELCLSDCHDLREIFSTEEVMKWYGMFPVESLEAIIELIDSLRKSYYEDRGMRWAIENKETGKLMGTCGFHNHNKAARRAEIGYELKPCYWNKGYIKEAIHAIMDYGCEGLNLHRIEAMIYPENLASQRAVEALGFEREGILKGYAYFRDTYQDLVMYAWIYKNHVRETL